LGEQLGNEVYFALMQKITAREKKYHEPISVLTYAQRSKIINGVSNELEGRIGRKLLRAGGRAEGARPSGLVITEVDN
jgi:hypothetical protein